MESFWSQLWPNVIGGVFTAGILALIYWAVNCNKRKNLSELVEIQEKIAGLLFEAEQYKERMDIEEWSCEASKILEKTIESTKKISPSAGALIEVSDEYLGGDVVQHLTSCLERIEDQIREILKAHI